MNGLGNIIKENCADEKTCKADILCKALFCHTYTLLQTLTVVNCTEVPLAQHHRQHQQGGITRQARPTTNALGTVQCINEAAHGSGAAAPPTAAPRAIAAAEMQPLEAVPASLPENFCWQCTRIRNKVGPLSHLPNLVVFSFGSEENKNTLWKPYPWRNFVCFSLHSRRKTFKNKYFPIIFDLFQDFVV